MANARIGARHSGALLRSIALRALVGAAGCGGGGGTSRVDPNGPVLRRSLTARLNPSGRQIDLAVKWRKRLAGKGELRFGSVWSLQPGHGVSEDPELSVFAGWRGSF